MASNNINVTVSDTTNINVASQSVTAVSFTSLSDTPSTYTDKAGYYVMVNSAENALEYISQSAAVDWGEISGTLSDQTDLQTELDSKLNLTGGTLTDTLTIDQNNDRVALNIDSDATTAASYGLKVYADQGANPVLLGENDNNHYQIRPAISTKSSHHFYRNLDSSNTGSSVMFIEQDNSGDDQNALNIQQDGTGNGIFIDQNGNGVGIAVDVASGTTNPGISTVMNGNGNANQIINQGIGNGLLLDQNGNGIALNIDSEATTTNVLAINAVNTDGHIVWIKNNGIHTDSSNALLKVHQTNTDATTDVKTAWFQNAAGSTGECVLIDQDGDGVALNVNLDGNPSYGIQLEKSAGTQNVRLLDTAQTTGSNWFYRNEASTTTAGPVMHIEQDNTGDDQNALSVQNDGTGTGLYVDNNGNSIAMEINSDATTNDVLKINAGDLTTRYGFNIFSDSLTSGRLISAYTDSASFTGNAIDLIIDNTGASGTGISLKNDGTGTGLFIDQNGNGFGIVVDNAGTRNSVDINHMGSAGIGIALQNEGTSNGLFIDQNGNGVALNIDSEATTSAALTITSLFQFAAVDVRNSYVTTDATRTWLAGPISGTATNYFYRDLTSANTASPLVFIEQDHTGDDQNALNIQQDGSGRAVSIANHGPSSGLNIDQNAVLNSSQYGLQVYTNQVQISSPLVRFRSDNTSATSTVLDITNDGTGNGILIDQDGDGIALRIDSEATTSYGLVVDMSVARTTANVIHIVDGNAATTANTARIRNEGSGTTLEIDSNGAGEALKIDSEATTGHVLDIDGKTNSYIIKSAYSQDLMTHLTSKDDGRGSNWFFRNLTSTDTVGPVAFIEQDNSGDDQAGLKIQNDGTGNGLFIDQNGNGVGLNIGSEATTTQAMYVRGQQTTASVLNYAAQGVLTNGNGAFVYAVENAASTGNVMQLINSGTGNGLSIDQNGDGAGLHIDSEATTAGAIIWNVGGGKDNGHIGEPDSPTASNYFARNRTSAETAGPLFRILNNNAGDDQNALNIQQDGTGNGLFIDQNGNGTALEIDSEDTTGHAISVNTNYSTSRYGMQITNQSATSATGGFRWLNDITRYGFVLGNGTTIYRLWVDDTGNLRMGSPDPATHDAGTVVGTQS